MAVTDDETSEINFVPNQNQATVAEGSGRHNVPVAINYAPAADLTIDYTIGGTATAGEDFTIVGLTGASGSVTASAGDTTVNIPVQIINDRVGEKHETIIFTLKESDDYNLHWPVTYTLTIEEDDGPRVEFTEESGSHDEGRSVYHPYIDLIPIPTEIIEINYSVSGGTATVGDDFRIESRRSLRATPGTAKVSLFVRVVNDALIEGDETVVFTLRDGDGYTLGANRKHTLTITDDDRPRAGFDSVSSAANEDDGSHDVTVDLDRPAPTGGLTLRYDVTGTARPGRDYTIADSGTVTVPAGEDSVNIPVSITDDQNHEPAETVILTLRPGSDYNLGDKEHTLTIRRSDLMFVEFAERADSVDESTGVHRAFINMRGTLHNDLTIKYVVRRSGSATAGDDFNIRGLTGASGSVTARAGTDRVAIPVSVIDDRVNEDDETIILFLQPGDGYISFFGNSVTTLTISDNDASVVSFDGFEGSVGEADGTYDVTVELDQGLSSDVAVKYRARGRATHGAGGDYTISDFGTVTIPAGARSAPIRITINDEADPTAEGSYEGEEMIILELEAGSRYTVGTPGAYRLTITDDDPPPDDLPVVSFRHSAWVSDFPWGECERYEGQGGCRPAFYVYGGDLPSPLDVAIKYMGGTATLNEDFEFFDDRVPGPEGVGEIFTVRVRADGADEYGVTTAWIEGIWYESDGKSERSETVIFRLVNGPGYVTGDVTDFTVTVKD